MSFSWDPNSPKQDCVYALFPRAANACRLRSLAFLVSIGGGGGVNVGTVAKQQFTVDSLALGKLSGITCTLERITSLWVDCKNWGHKGSLIQALLQL